MAKEKDSFSSLMADVQKVADALGPVAPVAFRVVSSYAKNIKEKEVENTTTKGSSVKKESAVKKEPAKARKETLQVETRKNPKTYFFPAEIVTLARDEGKAGYNIAYENNGLDMKIFIPKNDGVTEAKQLKYSKTNPNMLVITTERDATFKTFRTIVDEKAPNGERFIDSGAKVGTAALDKIQKEHSKFNHKEQEQPAKEDAKPEQDKGAVEQGTVEQENAGQETKKESAPLNKEDRPIWAKRESVVELKNGKGWFITGFSDDRAVFVPKKGDHLSARMLTNYLMVTADKEAKFDLYAPTGKGAGSYEKTDNWIRRDTVRQTVYRRNKEVEREQGKLKGTSQDKEQNKQIEK